MVAISTESASTSARLKIIGKVDYHSPIHRMFWFYVGPLKGKRVSYDDEKWT